MKTSLLIASFVLAAVLGTSVFAADQTPNKTALKQTNRSAMCNTPQGKLKKECAQHNSTQPSRH